MRVIVEVRSGASQGRKFPVRSGQKIQFGRTEWADAVFALDNAMSGVHFSLELTDDACLVRDLKSTNGTRVNGQFVTEAIVGEGDIIAAGTTEFVIQVTDRGKVTPKRPAANVVVDTARVRLDPSAASPSFRVESCPSELTLITGAMFGEPDEPTTVSEIMLPLSQRLPAFLLVDFKKCDQPIPEPHDHWFPLFDWLPADVAALHSPLIIPPAAHIDYPALVDAAWDQDAIVVFFSQHEPQFVIDHLRLATRLNLDGSLPADGEAKGMLGYCWPSVLAPLLAFRTTAFVGKLLSGIDAVLIEIPDLPEMWQIYAGSNFPALLTDMGFREVVDEEADP